MRLTNLLVLPVVFYESSTMTALFKPTFRLRFSVAVLILLATSACQAGLQQLEGYYRFGHEVNTVCIGQPEVCYWLVETPDDIRQQLKKQVEGKLPYTPVCLKLIAELSDDKADGFGQVYDGSIRVQQLIGLCDDEVRMKTVELKDLQHRRWVLHSVNDLSLKAYAQTLGFMDNVLLQKIPELDFGDQGHVFGNTACNQLQAKASVENGKLILLQQASTRMICAGFAGELELRLSMLYANPLSIRWEANTLTLTGEDTTLVFLLKDWVG